MASRKAVATAMGVLAVTLGQKFSEEAPEVWSMVLAPLTDEEVRVATFDVLRESTSCFAVAPGAIYQAACRREKGRLGPDAGEAWRMVRDVVCHRAERSTLPAVVEDVASRIGWEQLRELKLDDTWTRGQFLQLYDEARTSEVARRFGIRQELPAGETEAKILVAPSGQEREVRSAEGELRPISGLVDEIKRLEGGGK